MTKICVNMIVKNERSILERSLASIAPWIDAWVICDTGSSDGTQDLITNFFAARGILGELHSFPFEDFGQARNQALDLCRKSQLDFDYILLTDADMELVVQDDQFRSKISTPTAMVKQTGGTTSYWNTRLVQRDLACRYVELTHEYLDTAGAASSRVDGAFFVDHANGSSRSEKTARDRRLLERSLEINPNNVRSMFYLANTLRESGEYALAIKWYERRIAAGGWDEEVWHSALRIADCHRAAGDIPAFIAQALAAYQRRPHRAEPIHRLANHYRNAGQNELAMLFAEVGSRIAYPAGDSLFVDDEVYKGGFQEELSIAGFYCSKERRQIGYNACVELTTSRTASEHARRGARSNIAFYVRPLTELIPSVVFEKIMLECEPGYRSMNPSLCAFDGRLFGVVRTVNYEMDEAGRYTIGDSGGVIRTHNYFSEFGTEHAEPMCDLSPGPRTDFSVQGFEDCRLFRWRGGWWCSATVRDRTPGGACEIALLELDANAQVVAVYLQHGLEPGRHEKNWVPLVDEETLYFVYNADPTVVFRCDDPVEGCKVYSHSIPTRRLDHFRGSSQAIRVEGGWLYVAHESIDRPGRCRVYLHRFVHLNESFVVTGVSPPFRWHHDGVEFCAGLTRDPKDSTKLIAGFGVHDREAWVARFDESHVMAITL